MRAGLTILALLGFAASMNCCAETAFINIRADAEVGRLEVRLADVAEIATRKQSDAAQLGDAVVAKCRSLALPCHIEKADIVSALQTRAAELGVTLLWGANESATVHGRMRPLSLVPAIDRAAIRILQRMDRGFPLAVAIKDGPDAIEAPPGIAEFRPEFDQMRRSGANIELPMTVLVDGTAIGKPVIRYALRQDFGGAPQEPKASFSGDGHASARHPADGLETKSNAQTHEGFGASAAVTKNKKVRLLIDSGSLRVEAEGIALADAGVGETVRVKRPNGLADVRGRAVDLGTVLVEEN